MIFTSYQAYYVCASRTCAEDTEYVVRTRRSRRRFDKNMLTAWTMPLRTDAVLSWELYNSLVEEYTRRELTYSSDTLNAVSGCLKALGRYTEDVFLCGLPAKMFPLCLLWHSKGRSQRNMPWPSWSWAGWKGAVVNLATAAFYDRYLLKQDWKYTITTAIRDISFYGESGEIISIDQILSNDEQNPWMRNGDAHPLPEKESSSLGTLRFVSHSVLLSIVPEVSHIDKSELYKYKLMNGTSWIGTVFLTPECAQDNTTVVHNCEFVHLTSFPVTGSSFGPYLEGLPSSLWKLGSRTPFLFDEKYYNNWLSYSRIYAWREEVRMKHVMWIKRENQVVRRLAIGIIVDCELDWKEGEFWLE